jgi:tRNA threonylcarbamoyladenosine biosynthesis protein TsaB
MQSLIVDTSHEISYIILTQNNEIIFFKKIEKTHLSKELFQDIDNILKETNIDLSNLKFLATSVGPGSFTGLRVGATICKTLSFARKIPLVSYQSFEAYPPLFSGKFLSAIDAKSEGIYFIEGFSDQAEITYISEPKIISNNEAQKLFELHSIIISPDALVLKEKFKNHKDKFILSFFDPKKIADVTKNLYKKNKFTDFRSLNLLYLRGPNHIE